VTVVRQVAVLPAVKLCQVRIAATVSAHDLVDELHLMTFPVVLGTGKRQFAETPDKSV
jgi:dihydrofolate reductase